MCGAEQRPRKSHTITPSPSPPLSPTPHTITFPVPLALSSHTPQHLSPSLSPPLSHTQQLPFSCTLHTLAAALLITHRHRRTHTHTHAAAFQKTDRQNRARGVVFVSVVRVSRAPHGEKSQADRRLGLPRAHTGHAGGLRQGVHAGACRRAGRSGLRAHSHDFCGGGGKLQPRGGLVLAVCEVVVCMYVCMCVCVCVCVCWWWWW